MKFAAANVCRRLFSLKSGCESYKNDDEGRKQNFSIPPKTILSLLLLVKKNLLYFFFSPFLLLAVNLVGSITRVIGGIVLKGPIFVIVF